MDEKMMEGLAGQFRGEMAMFRHHLREAVSHASRASLLLVTPRGEVPRREWFRWLKQLAKSTRKETVSAIVSSPMPPERGGRR